MAAAHQHDVDGAKRFRDELRAAREEVKSRAPGYAAKPIYQTGARAKDLWVDAEIAAAEGNGASAQEALRQVVALEPTVIASDGAYPGRASACERLGELALGAGRDREAVEHLECALERTPGRSRTLRLAALAAEHTGNKARAAELWEALGHNWAQADADFSGASDLRVHGPEHP
jgi:Tfp pilus assembly protein PilF